MTIAEPRDPVTTTPPREAGSVRRTTSVDILRPDGMTGDIILHGRARDLLTGASGTTAETIGEAALRARVGLFDRKLAVLELWPEEPSAATLIGRMVGAGFRAAINPALGGTPVFVLLDDLPVATLISGYASLRVDSGLGADMARAASAYAARGDICSGWRIGGTMLNLIARDHVVPVPDCPPAPDLDHADDPDAWHLLDGLPPGSMRRRRRIDVRRAQEDDGFVIDAMFRDSFWEVDGTEVVLHEYHLDAIVDDDGVLGGVSAQPRVLPYPECPWAAASAQRLEGVNVADLPAVVKEELVGTSTCTHLNDLFRSLRDVHRLGRLIADPGAQ